MHFIKQIISGKVDDWVHQIFTRYGRGDFTGPVFEIEIGKNIKYKVTEDYVTAFVYACASCGGNFNVDGTIFAKDDFRPDIMDLEIEFEDKSKPKKNYYVADINVEEMPAETLQTLVGKIPYALVLLNLKGDNAKLKCKKKPTKPGKDKVLDFCSGTMDLKGLPALKDEVLFDCGDFTKACGSNKYIIEEVVVPTGVDSATARLQAKRKGKLVRTIDLDGVVKESEMELLV